MMKVSRTRQGIAIAHLFTLIALVGMLAVSAMAQTTTGSIYGTVADASGAIIPDSAVTVKNLQTGETHSTKSNTSGNYIFPVLEPGDYSAVAKVAGFQTVEQNHIRLDASRNVHVSFSLPVGSQDQTVTVSAATTLVDTRGSQLGETVDQKQIQDLPLNGRNVYDLVQMVPGVTNYSPAKDGGDSGGTTFQVNGNRPNDNSYYLDGVFDTNIYRNGGSNMPNPDALQEFRILTSNFDAEYGREPGGVVNAITRSGSNKFHGGVYDYIRNNVLNSKSYFDKGVTPLKRNQFGATFGGPILRDKTFFFLSYEGLRLNTSSTITSASLVTPTPLEAVGDFTASPASRRPNSPAVSCGGVANK
ncbi:MAG: carboxypeptidase regulatory-like domain-containing protein, partial [Edaphobacter sp.]